jgi:hypothetical protein
MFAANSFPETMALLMVPNGESGLPGVRYCDGIARPDGLTVHDFTGR